MKTGLSDLVGLAVITNWIWDGLASTRKRPRSIGLLIEIVAINIDKARPDIALKIGFMAIC